MPNTLPIPSKAALRTLRNLALGTSCTIAFTTGMLTEDRRRRIHSASEVHKNAKKLKSSRKYHSAGSSSAETFEEQVMRYRDDGFWQANDSPKTTDSSQSATRLKFSTPQLADSEQEQLLSFKPSEHIPITPKGSKWTPIPLLPTIWRPIPAIPPDPPTLPPAVKGQTRNRQQKLASDVTKLLQDKEDLSNVEASAVRFFDAFEEGLHIHRSGLSQQLIDAAIQLSIACQAKQKLQAHSKILDIVLEHGPIDQETFFSLGAERIVKDLIKTSHDDAAGHMTLEESKLRKATALYLVKFTEKPKIATDTWHCLGETLCGMSCRQGLYDLTEAVYWRVDQCRGDALNHSLTDLMTALFEQGYHAKVVKAFRRFFANSMPDKQTFYKTGNMVIESTLELRRFDIAEEVLSTLAKMSEDRGVKCPASWFANVLRSDWESHHDIDRARAFFERLVVSFYGVKSPQAVYGAIIQCCVEAGDENAAQVFFERLQMEHGSLDASGVRILGHFAYAKALRNDWAGVKEDFREMWQLNHGIQGVAVAFKEKYSASFIPVFTLFSKTHSVNETEEFLRTFINHHNVILKPYMSTTMITKYAEAHEIDSISRWLDYMISVGSPPDAMFFNAIISHCRTKRKFCFEEMYRLYQKVRKVEGHATNFINDDTFSILRRAAIAEARSDIAGTARRLNRLNLDQPLRLGVDCRRVQEQMAVALASGDPEKAIRVFERAQKNVIPLDMNCINTAVKALLQIDPRDVRTAANLLHKPQTDGLDVSSAVATIFTHQMSYQCSATQRTRTLDVTRNTFAMLEERGITIQPSMITHTMHTLVRQGKYYQATEFWDSMSRRQNGQTTLDLRTLTVLLQAFLRVKDCVGVEWAVQMLPANGLSPDAIFKRSLKNALREARKLLGEESAAPERQFCKFIEGALQTVSTMRQEAIANKEDFKVKTINIMEKAIEFQRTTEVDVNVKRSSKSYIDLNIGTKRSGKTTFASQIGGDLEVSEEWSMSPEPDYFVDVPPLSKLAGSL